MIVSAGALALFGLTRLIFNLVGVRVFGAEFVGTIGALVSMQTLVAVLAAGVPSVLATKFVAEYMGRSETLRAETLFAGTFWMTAGLGLIAAALTLFLGSARAYPALVAYAPAFGLYLLLKGTYFSFGMQSKYVRAESLAAAIFILTFYAACIQRNGGLAVASLLMHPLSFCIAALVDHRNRFRGKGVVTELRLSWRRYIPFSLATLANVMSGLGSYHLLVVLASLVLDRLTVGYLNVMLAAAAPIACVGAAYGTAAFPEMAGRLGRGDEAGTQELILKSTLLLQALSILGASAVFLAPEFALVLIGVPPTRELSAAWCCIGLSLLLNMVSAPAGHALNASRLITWHSVLSMMFLILGSLAGLAVMSQYGVVGAGVMRLIGDGALSIARIGLSQRLIPWWRNAPWQLLAGQLALVLLFVVAVLQVGPTVSIPLWSVCALVFGGMQLQMLRADSPRRVD